MQKLTQEQLATIRACAKSARRSIIEMTTNAASGHPGGSLSCIDYLSLLYTQIICETGNPVLISNGHISPAVYSILGEMGYIDKEDTIKTFRKFGSIFEGHVTRHVPGVWYGTGPLGIGGSVASAFALSKKLTDTVIASEAKQSYMNQYVFALMGDGEADEGQVYEMMHFAAKYHLSNLVLFIDANDVQLSASTNEIMPIKLAETFRASDWNVYEVDGHDIEAMWEVLRSVIANPKGEAILQYSTTNKIASADLAITRPHVIIGHTIMGKGVSFMEHESNEGKATWHGVAPKNEDAKKALAEIGVLTEEESSLLNEFRRTIQWKPKAPEFPTPLSQVKIEIGTPMLSPAGTSTDCRSAYGKALLDLAKRNPNILAITADLRDSVKTGELAKELPNQHIECGIAEQHMMSLAGGLSLEGWIPFASTFAAFATSRAKDQVRVNDINNSNVKIVSTHAGLSVGEDGPTHQAIDDMGSMLGLLHTMVIEPADANQTDHIIRYIASHYGNFYVRMGRHKFPVILKEDGKPFYDEKYTYEYGKCDVMREGKDLTIVASGAQVGEAVKAREELLKKHPEISIEIIAASSIKEFDDTLKHSLRKTGKVITVEDHNTYTGLGAGVVRFAALEGIPLTKVQMLGVEKYQLSGKVEELYENAGIDKEGILKVIKEVLCL